MSLTIVHTHSHIAYIRFMALQHSRMTQSWPTQPNIKQSTNVLLQGKVIDIVLSRVDIINIGFE